MVRWLKIYVNHDRRNLDRIYGCGLQSSSKERERDRLERIAKRRSKEI